MNPLTRIWFWIAVIAIICIIVAYSFSEGVGQSFGNNDTTPTWVWIVWGVGLVLLVISFVLYCISASREYNKKIVEEACNPKPKVEKPIVCPVKKPCGCAIEVHCACVKPAPVAHHEHHQAPPPPVVHHEHHQSPPPPVIHHDYVPAYQPHLYYSPAPVPVAEPVNINIQETTAQPIYTSFPQAPGYPSPVQSAA